MSQHEIDRSDPAVRASLAVRDFERRQRASRIVAALILIALAVGGPFAAAPLTGGPGATFGAIVAAVLFAGSAVVIWPWSWSKAERASHERRDLGPGPAGSRGRDRVGPVRGLGAGRRRPGAARPHPVCRDCRR
jgi:hypothetical protein